MKSICFIFGDQLSDSISSLARLDHENDVVFMCEVLEEATHVKHHQQKIAFTFSAMRHFASHLAKQGINIHYVKLDDPCNTGSFDGEIKRVMEMLRADKIILTEPSEYRVLEKVRAWQKLYTVEIIPDSRFLCTHAEFDAWITGKKQPRMEYFYRYMRQKHQFLMTEDNNPVGRKWNYDKENRRPLKGKIEIPDRITFEKDRITLDVLELVKTQFHDHFGELALFEWAVTRDQALQCLDFFIEKLLPQFGDYQDAMRTDEAFLFHSTLSPYLNSGLLLPLEVCRKAEQAYLNGSVSLSSAEGFIRQILGWREYIRGIYWHNMPNYAKENFFNAQRKLPSFYWDGQTEMNCLREVVQQTKRYAYSHHIQRLMITGNFALLAGLDPMAVCEWYLIVYADAFEWVELPNTLGMALYGDGGLLASKPYAASGNYINRMSNFCKNCRYNPDETVGDNACPFNSLYWRFISVNEDKLGKNPRFFYMYSHWRKMPDQKKAEILGQSEDFLSGW